MILDTDIHNFYEHLVLKEIEKQGLNQRLTPYSWPISAALPSISSPLTTYATTST